MNAVALWYRTEWRTRWRALVGLMLLIAFAVAGLSAAVAGARRGSTSVDRLLAETKPATLAVLLNRGPFDWDVVRDIPGVEAVTGFVVSNFGVEGLGEDSSLVQVAFPPTDPEVWSTIEAPVVLDGRLPDPARVDEVAVTQHFVDHFGRGVGDPVTLRLYTPQQIDELDEGAPRGPAIDATIVAVIRSGWFTDSLDTPAGILAPTPALFDQYRANVMGASDGGDINALVRLSDRSDEAITAFTGQFTARTGIENVETMDLVALADHARNVVRFEARAMLLLALAGAVASLLLIGIAVTRFCTVSFTQLDVLRACGFVPAQTRAAVVAAPASAALAGGILGVCGAALISGRFPIGTAADLEPAPGIDVDPLVMLGAVALVIAFAAVVSAWTVRRRARTESTAASGIVAALTSVWPLRTGMGTRLALERGRGRRSTNSIAALVAGMLGVTGIVATLVFSAGVDDATDGYERFGQTYELATFLGEGGEDFVDVDATFDTITADPAVVGAINLRNDFATGPIAPVSVFTYAPVGTPDPVVVTAGRLPRTASEITLGPESADAPNVDVGDTIQLVGTRDQHDFTITGIAFVPAGPHNGYADGAWLLPEAFDHLFDGFRFHFGVVSATPDADVPAIVDRLTEAGLAVQAGPIIPPTERAELAQLRMVPRYLAVFLGLLALGATAHTLSSTARRRRHDFAMLRALGLRPRDTTVVVCVQAVVIALVSLLVGVPLGAVIGRAVWRAVALDTPVQFVAPTAWVLVIVTCAVVVFAANVLAAWPSRRIATTRLGAELRCE